jgi:hypothetical protein
MYNWRTRNSHLKKKASPPQDTTTLPQEPASHTQKAVSYKPLSWPGWTEIFAQGLLDTANFVLNLFSLKKSLKKRRMLCLFIVRRMMHLGIRSLCDLREYRNVQQGEVTCPLMSSDFPKRYTPEVSTSQERKAARFEYRAAFL